MSDLNYIKAKCEQFGNTFFDPEAMRFFNSRIGKVLRIDSNTYRIITSERFEDEPRRYTVREFSIMHNSVRTNSVSEFQEYATREEAIKHIKDGI